MVHLDESTHLYERILDLAPQAVDKIQQIISGNKNESRNKEKNKQTEKNNNSQEQR